MLTVAGAKARNPELHSGLLLGPSSAAPGALAGNWMETEQLGLEPALGYGMWVFQVLI